MESSAEWDVVALRVDVAEARLRETRGEVVAGAGERGAKWSASLSNLSLATRSYSQRILVEEACRLCRDEVQRLDSGRRGGRARRHGVAVEIGEAEDASGLWWRRRVIVSEPQSILGREDAG